MTETIDNLRSDLSIESKERMLFSVEQISLFKPVLSFLNEKDRDILYLIFLSGKKQKDVESIIGRSQPSLCYDIKRIRKRLKFVFYLNDVFDIFMDFFKNHRGYFTEKEMSVMILMFYSSSFTTVSEVLKIRQVKARYLFDKCLRKLEESKNWEIFEIMIIIRDNLNMVKRLYKKNNSSRGIFIC